MTSLRDRFASRLRALVDASGAGVESIRTDVLTAEMEAARQRAQKKGTAAEDLESHADRDRQVAAWAARLDAYSEARAALDSTPALVGAYAATLSAEVEDMAGELFTDDALCARVLAAVDVDAWPVRATGEGGESWAVGVTGVLAPSCRNGALPEMMDITDPNLCVREDLRERLDEAQMAGTRVIVRRMIGDHLRKGLVTEKAIAKLRTVLGRWHEGERLEKLCDDARETLPYAMVVRPREDDAYVWPSFIQPRIASGTATLPTGEKISIGPEGSVTVFHTNPSDMPPADARPWWPVVGLALLLDAERRVRPELPAWTTLQRENEGPDPGEATRAAARDACGGDDADGGLVDRVARAVFERLPALLEAVWPDGEPPDDDAAREADSGGLLRASEAAASFLAGIGPAGEVQAAALRNVAVESWQAFTAETGDAPPTPEALQALWSPWRTVLDVDVANDADDADRISARWWPRIALLNGLARAVLEDEVQPETERAAAAAPLQVYGATAGADVHAKIPTIIAPLSWAIEGAVYRQDGESYTEQPLMSRAVVLYQRDGGVVPEYARQIPIRYLDPPQPLAETIAKYTGGHDLPVLAGKLGLLLCAAAPSGNLVRATLREIARLLYPNDKTLRRKYYRRLAAASWSLRLLSAVPDGRTDVQPFDVVCYLDPNKVTGDDEFIGGLSQTFRAAMAGEVYRAERLAYTFVHNLSGTMRLDNRKSQLIRAHVWSSAHWNDCDRSGSYRVRGRLPASRVQALSYAELAPVCAIVSPGTMAGQRRRADGTAARRTFEELEAEELVRLELAAQTYPKRVRIMPPPAYLEAYPNIRKAGPRPLLSLPTRSNKDG